MMAVLMVCLMLLVMVNLMRLKLDILMVNCSMKASLIEHMMDSVIGYLEGYLTLMDVLMVY